jgi:hypothetical protein
MATEVAILISTLMARRSDEPMFSKVCGGRGADQSADPLGDFAMDLLSNMTIPLASRRMKSLQLKMYSTLGQRCVCNGAVSPGGTQVSNTRTESFSSNSTWCLGAAINASSSWGHIGLFGIFSLPSNNPDFNCEQVPATSFFRNLPRFPARV